MFRTTALLAALIALVPFEAAQAKRPARGESALVNTDSGCLNLRRSAYRRAGIVSCVAKNAPVTILNYNPRGFSRVRTDDGVGYVWSSYLLPSSQVPLNSPAVTKVTPAPVLPAQPASRPAVITTEPPRNPALPPNPSGIPSFTNVNLTGYSAACRRHDGRFGGPNQTAWHTRLRPRSHTLDGPALGNTIVVAAPQRRGTASLFGCYIDLDFSASNVPAHIRAKFAGKKIFVGDKYGSGSNGRLKLDVSHECTNAVKNFNFRGVKVVKRNCYSKAVYAGALPPEAGQSRVAAAASPAEPSSSR